MTPTLETERLVLRAHTLSDFDHVVRLWADPEVVRHIGGKPSTREQSWQRLLRYAGHWRLLGFGFWAVFEKGTNAFAGEVGVADFKREGVASFEGAHEAGWVLAHAAHGKGYATEAMRAALAWNEAKFPEARRVCMVDVDNAASIRVANKLGYREYERTTYNGSPVVLFER